jgi:hypothetical protein
MTHIDQDLWPHVVQQKHDYHRDWLCHRTRWLETQHGGSWRGVWKPIWNADNRTWDFYFKYQQDATLFALRWSQ